MVFMVLSYMADIAKVHFQGSNTMNEWKMKVGQHQVNAAATCLWVHLKAAIYQTIAVCITTQLTLIYHPHTG